MYTETTNSRGFRGSEEYGSKPDGVYRIVCLGDSWTYGVMVNDHETYPAQLCQVLNAESSPRRFEVLNLGCVGYSSYQGKVLLAKYIRQLAPDLVTICFGGNDARRSRLFSDREQPRIGEWVILVQSMLGKSRFYQVFRNQLLGIKKRASLGREGAAPIQEWPQRVSPDDYEANMREIISLARQNNCAVVFLFYLGTCPCRDRLEKLSAETGIPLVDVNEILCKNPDYAVKDLSIDYPRDTHPNARGYSLIARKLEEVVREVADGNPYPAAPAPPPENNRRR